MTTALDHATDTELLAQFVADQSQAPFAELVRRHGVMVSSVCRRNTSCEHDAEDAAQRVFLTLAQKAPRLRQTRNIAGWLFRTAHNVSRELHRAMLRRKRYETEASSPMAQHQNADQQQREWREALDHQLATLPTKYREPIVLHHLEGLPHKQAARQMGLAENTFAVRLTRARDLLKSRMMRSGLAFSTASWALLENPSQTQACEVLASPGFFLEVMSHLEKNSTMITRTKLALCLLMFSTVVGGLGYAFSKQDSAQANGNNPQPAPEKPIKPAEISAQIKSNNQFALEFYHKVLKHGQHENFCYSPLSVSTCFGMAYAGSKTTSEKEIRQAFRFQTGTDRLPWVLREHNRDLLRRAQKHDAALEMANAMVMVDEVNPDFKKAILNQFDGEIIIGDDPLKLVNDWVKEKTHGKIPKMLKRLNNTVCVLLNAIYFESAWEKPFVDKWTTNSDFELADGKKVKVPMMGNYKEFRYLINEEIQMIDLPYKEDQCSMVLFLPGQKKSFQELQRQLTHKTMSSWMKKLDDETPRFVSVRVPRFRLATMFDFEKMKELLGLTKSFQQGKADFSGIGGSPGDIYIAQAIHKCVVEVDEKGTAATGATVIEMGKTGGKPDQLHFNQPFVFVIRDKKTGAVLFVGRVMDPRVE